MYFWRIEKLKKEMVARPLSEREVLPYLVVFVFLSAALSYSTNTDSNGWDDLGVVSNTLMAVLGAVYIYRRNGGAAGQHFLQRYLAVGWVVAIRCLPILILGMVVLHVALSAMQFETERTSWCDFVFGMIAETVVYWRIGHHVRDLSQRTSGSP